MRVDDLSTTAVRPGVISHTCADRHGHHQDVLYTRTRRVQHSLPIVRQKYIITACGSTPKGHLSQNTRKSHDRWTDSAPGERFSRSPCFYIDMSTKRSACGLPSAWVFLGMRRNPKQSKAEDLKKAPHYLVLSVVRENDQGRGWDGKGGCHVGECEKKCVRWEVRSRN